MHFQPLLFRLLCALLGLANLAAANAPAMMGPGSGLLHMQAMLASRASTGPTVPPFFNGTFGGAPALITKSNDAKRPYSVGGDTFPDFNSAAMRVCSMQHNSCAQMANNGTAKAFSVSMCDTQSQECYKAAASATITTFAAVTTSSSSSVAVTTTSSSTSSSSLVMSTTVAAAPTLVTANATMEIFCDP